MRGRYLWPSRIAQRNGSTRLLDFFTGARADFIGFDCQTVLQFTIGNDFDSSEMTTGF